MVARLEDWGAEGARLDGWGSVVALRESWGTLVALRGGGDPAGLHISGLSFFQP